MPTKPSLTLKRRLKAPPEKVYKAWTVPEEMMRWWGGNNPATHMAATDVRVGGRFDVGFKSDNGEQHNVGGFYREVVPNEKLVFTWRGAQRRSANRWSPSISSPTATAPS